MIERILPRQAGNDFQGLKPALWLLGLFVFVKIAMGLNSILNTESVATGADGIRLDGLEPATARTILNLFAMTSLGQLVLALVALVILVRYRALVPFAFLLLLGESLARRLIAMSATVSGSTVSPLALSINLGLIALLALGLVLSLIPARKRDAAPREGDTF
jgi:hypothetical protein